MEAVSLCVFLKATGINIFRAARGRNRKPQPLGWAARPLPTLCRVLNSGQKTFRLAFATLRIQIAEIKADFDAAYSFQENLAA